MYFEVETTNRPKSEHSVLKLWLSTCHGDLDTLFLNIDSLIEGQMAYIKASLEFSRTKKKFNAKIIRYFFIVSNKISHLALKKIWSEIPRAVGIYDDPKNKSQHYLRTSHCLSCSCELITRFDHVLSLQLSDIEAFWKILEIGGRYPSARRQDMDSKMRSLTNLLHQIRVLSPVLSEDLGVTLISPPEIAVTKGWKKTNSTKRDNRADLVLALNLDLGRGRVRVLGRDPMGEGDHHKLLVEEAEGATVSKPKARRRMLYELEHSTNVYVNLVGPAERVNGLVHRIRWQDGPTSYEHWLEIPDSLYVIANAFNLFAILIAQLGSTTVLPLYSYSDRPRDTLVIGLLTEQQHFIQLQMHDGY
ncbi:hypothetical protein M9H77_35731 [Catharanthus roseus]|uniref:Uncharacterized protein n=1 Tax=Catharanthus roseus TaxID=4058 RepID=A0ACB9ZR40_CATRO|nr:hypothetical protein M9H77_35731 [Catharanthus roseus]